MLIRRLADVLFCIHKLPCRSVILQTTYFLPKNDMILPCPLPADLPLGALTAGFFLGGGAGSSSEKDSHDGSSTVTGQQ